MARDNALNTLRYEQVDTLFLELWAYDNASFAPNDDLLSKLGLLLFSV